MRIAIEVPNLINIDFSEILNTQITEFNFNKLLLKIWGGGGGGGETRVGRGGGGGEGGDPRASL